MRKFSFLALMVLLWPLPLRADGNADAGRKIATDHCSRCHVIPEFNPHGGIGSTPSFRLLAEMDDGLERFETFFARRPHPSFVRVPEIAPPTDLPTALEPVEMSRSDIDDLVAYARKLREWQE